MDLRELDRRAMSVTSGIVAGIKPAQLGSPTPCEGWLVSDLLAHIIGQNHGFALAATGQRTSLEDFRHRPVGDDIYASYTAAAGVVTEAFAGDGVLDRSFHLPEIRDGGPFPAPMAISFHLVDEVVHGWDLARSVGGTAGFGGEVLAAALKVSLRVPNDPAGRGQGFPFALGHDPGEDVPVLDRIVALLGRDPQWNAASAGG
jgi:uncharacterized protein (TIGR03086 family)